MARGLAHHVTHPVMRSVTRGARRWLAAAALALAPSVAGAHDVHVSHARLVIEGRTVVLRVRLFADDLERALRSHSGDAALRVSTPAADSAFARYFGARVSLTADGARLAPRISAAGDEKDVGGYAMRWYVVELEAARPVARLALRNTLMFDLFRDQQNIVTALRMPGERRTTLFFASGDTKEQTLEK